MTNLYYTAWIVIAGCCIANSPVLAGSVLADEHNYESQEALPLEGRKTALIGNSIRLDNPYQMSVLKEHEPELSERVLAIVRAGRTVSLGDFQTRVKTDYHAESVEASPILYTSSPPQRYLSFVLDGIRFHGFVQIPDYRGISTRRDRHKFKAY